MEIGHLDAKEIYCHTYMKFYKAEFKHTQEGIKLTGMKLAWFLVTFMSCEGKSIYKRSNLSQLTLCFGRLQTAQDLPAS